jgi:N4-gp56 family major capsid protein
MKTIVGLGDAKAVQRYSAFLAVDTARKSYFNKKFMGEGIEAETPIQILRNLENDAGDKISYDLVMQLRMQPVEGDNTLEGREEDLKFYTDSVLIDQMRGGVNTGGRMTRKRTIHDLRKVARARQSDWWARVFDELFFMYLSGARGVNSEFIYPTTYTGFATNLFVAPDTQHLLYAGAATSKLSLASTDKVTLATIDKAKVKATMLGGGTSGIPAIEPMMIDGEGRYVFLMNPFQAYDVRTNTSTGQWLDVQKSLATAIGNASPIYKGGLGLYNDVVLHEHKAVIRFSDYGAGSNVAAARGLFLGRQAAVVAFGSSGNGLRFDWHEEARDNGNQAVITTSTICGIKKTAFTIAGTSRDFGIISVDSAAADPNP